MASEIKEKEMSPQEEIWNYILGFAHIAAVKCAIELKIPDILENHKSPMTLIDLASEIGCSQASLHRIMRFLVHNKVFEEKSIFETSVGYVQTPLSKLLTKNAKGSMVDLLVLTTSPAMVAPWQKLSASVLNNDVIPFEAANGIELWGFTGANPGFSKLFNDGMACEARVVVSAVLEGYREVFEGLTTLVDVGGGDGTSLRLIVEACPWIKGINFDLPHVVSVAPTSNGVEHVGGSMFDYVPKADAVCLQKVLHDWADEECIEILQKCREAIPRDTGKVIIVDGIIGREEDHKFKGVGLMFDLCMMGYTNKGKERTLKEWSYVFHEAGFTRYIVKHIEAPQSIIELFP